MGQTISVTVVVCTYRRVGSLGACLDGVRGQTSPADEIVVVVHREDVESAEFVARRSATWPGLRSVTVQRDGMIAALNRGLDAASGQIVAFVDDDAVPETDWLERIVATFDADPAVAAVGGRDQIAGCDGLRASLVDRVGGLQVGRVQWFGRMIANHHLGTGRARDVDVLKGVNMSFRRDEVAGLGFDERLLGRGAQLHSELSICLPLRQRGLRVVYDPRILVKHYPAVRPAGDDRGRQGADEVYFAAHNEALAIFDYLGPRRGAVFALWGLIVGSSGAPGCVVLIRELIGQRPRPWARLFAAQRGRAAAFRTHRVSPRGDQPPSGLALSPRLDQLAPEAQTCRIHQ